jgi:glutamate dehydrogenase
VDCSDHEVNIKILLDQLVTGGTLDKERRDELLAEMTDEVAHLVLADNYSQNAVLGVSRAHAQEMLTVLARLVADLEEHSGLDRRLEALPTKTQFRDMDKNGEGLTSPELATLLAHVKLRLKHEVLASSLPDTDVFARRLPEYFPTRLRERFGDAVPQHPLSRQITTTLVVNEVVDGGGVSYAFRLAEETNASATDAVRAFTAVTKIFDLPALWRQIQTLDNVVATDVADHMTLETRRLLDRASRWLLSNRPQPLAVGAEINRFHDVVAELVHDVPNMVRGAERDAIAKKADDLVAANVPVDLARRIGSLLDCYPLLDVIEVAELADRDSLDTERSPRETAELYYALSDHLEIDSMLTSISALERGNRWHALARLALRDDLYSSLRAITLDVLRQSDPGTSADEKITNWERINARRIDRSRASLEEIRRAGSPNLATLSVATRQVRSMVR